MSSNNAVHYIMVWYTVICFILYIYTFKYYMCVCVCIDPRQLLLLLLRPQSRRTTWKSDSILKCAAAATTVFGLNDGMAREKKPWKTVEVGDCRRSKKSRWPFLSRNTRNNTYREIARRLFTGFTTSIAYEYGTRRESPEANVNSRSYDVENATRAGRPSTYTSSIVQNEYYLRFKTHYVWYLLLDWRHFRATRVAQNPRPISFLFFPLPRARQIKCLKSVNYSAR